MTNQNQINLMIIVFKVRSTRVEMTLNSCPKLKTKKVIAKKENK